MAVHLANMLVHPDYFVALQLQLITVLRTWTIKYNSILEL